MTTYSNLFNSNRECYLIMIYGLPSKLLSSNSEHRITNKSVWKRSSDSWIISTWNAKDTTKSRKLSWSWLWNSTWNTKRWRLWILMICITKWDWPKWTTWQGRWTTSRRDSCHWKCNWIYCDIISLTNTLTFRFVLYLSQMVLLIQNNARPQFRFIITFLFEMCFNHIQYKLIKLIIFFGTYFLEIVDRMFFPQIIDHLLIYSFIVL